MTAYAEPVATPQPGFTQVPNHIMKNSRLSLGSRMLYNILLSYCWHKDTCFPSYDTLMADMGCGSQALSGYIKELMQHGLLAVIRRGYGKTNLYQLTEVVQPAPTPQPAPAAGEEEPSSLKIKEHVLWKSKTKEYEVNEYPDRYLSNNRRAKNGGEDYVNNISSTDKPQDSTQPSHQTRLEQYKHQHGTTARNIEEIEPQKEKAPTRENRHDGYEDITRGLLLEYMTDFATEFNDQAPLQSSITRAYHLYRQSGLTMDAFTTYLYTARAVTKERTASIRKMTERGFKAKMPYFFAVLEDRLGLRHKQLKTVYQSA